MNSITLEILLRLAGLILLGLVLANFVAAQRFNYAKSLTSSATIVRQIFYVHSAYIIALIGALAILCLGWPGLLLADTMGRVLCGFFALFWASRVIVQLTYYDRQLRRNDRAWDLFFLAVFATLSIIFSLATIHS